MVVGYTGGKEGFRTRWKIYGEPVDKLCFISRDVIFIKAAGRCLLPLYPASQVVSLYVYTFHGVYVSEKHCARIYAAIYRSTDACIADKRYADGSLKRVEISSLWKKTSVIRATSFTYTLPNWGEVSVEICYAREFPSDLISGENPYKWFKIIFSSDTVSFYPSSLPCNFSPL